MGPVILATWSWEIDCDIKKETSIAEAESPGERFLRVSTERLCSRDSQGYSSCSWSCDRRITQVALALKAGGGHGQQVKLGTVWQGWIPWKEPRRGSLVAETRAQLQQKAIDSGDASTMRCLSRTSTGMAWSLEAKLCGLQRTEPEKWPRPFEEAQQLKSESQTSGQWIIHTVGSSILLCSDCDCALVLPSWNKKVFNLFFILQESTVERL